MSTGHSTTHHGLQNHSVGEIYPYSIKRIGDKYYQPFHCLTGEEGPKFCFTNNGSNHSTAYKCAEQWAIRQLEKIRELKEGYSGLQNHSVDAQRELTEHTFLIPRIRGSNDAHHAHATWHWLEHELLSAFGGFTIGREVQGYWEDSDGQLVKDTSIPYSVATNDVDALLGIVTKTKKRFDQQCIYFAKTATSVRLI